MISFLIALILNASCTENKNLNKELNKSEITLDKATDTLKFTKGVRSILQDSKGNYWFGANQEGLCKYDGKTFTYYTPENGFCGKQVIAIEEDERGTIWFATSTGLCSYDGVRFNSNINPFHYSSWTISSTDLWFPGKNSNEIIRIDKGNYNKLKNPIEIPAGDNPGDYDITGFSKSKTGALWIAYYKGVAHYDGKTIQYINDSLMHFDGKSKYMHVRSILEDSKGRVWIGNNGIGVFLKEGATISHFSDKNNLLKGEMSGAQSEPGTLMHVFAIKEDAHANIWFGDRDTGAWRYDGKEMKNFVVDPKLKTQFIWNIYEDKNGSLLFAMAERGIYKFNGNGFDRVF